MYSTCAVRFMCTVQCTCTVAPFFFYTCLYTCSCMGEMSREGVLYAVQRRSGVHVQVHCTCMCILYMYRYRYLYMYTVYTCIQLYGSDVHKLTCEDERCYSRYSTQYTALVNVKPFAAISASGGVTSRKTAAFPEPLHSS